MSVRWAGHVSAHMATPLLLHTSPPLCLRTRLHTRPHVSAHVPTRMPALYFCTHVGARVRTHCAHCDPPRPQSCPQPSTCSTDVHTHLPTQVHTSPGLAPRAPACIHACIHDQARRFGSMLHGHVAWTWRGDTDLCTDVCTDMCHTHLYKHAHRHVHRHAYRHVCLDSGTDEVA